MCNHRAYITGKVAGSEDLIYGYRTLFTWMWMERKSGSGYGDTVLGKTTPEGMVIKVEQEDALKKIRIHYKVKAETIKPGYCHNTEEFIVGLN